MNILVLNGSPKGQYSVTLQTCRYLEALYSDHTFSYLNVAQKIKSLEKDFFFLCVSKIFLCVQLYFHMCKNIYAHTVKHCFFEQKIEKMQTH